jgi:thiosulfate/3-mercaptopyruvate sulfurtransferase
VIGVHPEIAAIIVERAIADAEPFSNSSCFFPKNHYIFGNFVLNRIASIYEQKGAVAMANYSNPEVLVSTDWVEQHKNDPNVVLAEVDVDTTAYNEGHVPGAIGWNWQTQLCDTVRRDVISKADLEKLLGGSGVGNDTTVVLYGDNNNWFAAWAFWQLKMYGHKDVRIMNGGRKKWLAENRTLSKDAPTPKAKTYRASERNDSLRAYLPQVQSAMKAPGYVMVDVRSPDEFSGKILSPPGLPETCQRGGHIPGAKSIPWAQACNEDGTFKARMI